MNEQGMWISFLAGSLWSLHCHMKNRTDTSKSSDMLLPLVMGGAGGVLGWYMYDVVIPSQTTLANVGKGLLGKFTFEYFLFHV